MNLEALSQQSPTSAWSPESVQAFVGCDHNDPQAFPDSVFEFCREPHAFLLRLARAEGPVARFRINNEILAVSGDPNVLHAALNGSSEDFEKGDFYDMIEAAFGKGIFTVDGSEWTSLHAVLTPLFSRARIQALAPLVGAAVDDHLERWDCLARNGEPVDLLSSAKRLAFDVVARGLIGIEDEEAADRLFAALHQADRTEAVRLRFLGKRLPAIGGHFPRSPLQEEIDRVAFAIAERRIGATMHSGDRSTEDLIGGAMATEFFRNLPGDRQRRFIRDLVASMLSAGYVTTGEALFWSLYLLARHTDAQERARHESSSPWLPAVISESLRLYPPAWFLGRIVRRTIRLGDTELCAGTRLICSPWVLHRMPSLWSDPDEFRPERFLLGSTVPPRSYIPFGSGMHACIGRALAMMQLSKLLPATLARFDVTLVQDTPITLAGTFSMQPRERVLIRMTPR